MAARKRVRKSPDSPNTILVIFLVIFILATMGGFGWALSMIGKQQELEGMARKAKDKETALVKAQNWLRYQALETCAALGDVTLVADPTKPGDLSQRDEKRFDFWKTSRMEFLDTDDTFKDGAFKGEDPKERDALRNLIIKAKKDLGWDAATHSYKKSYFQVNNDVAAELRKSQTEYAALFPKHKALEEEYRSLDAKHKKVRDDAFQAIKDNGKATLEKAGAMSEAMTKTINDNLKFQELLTEEKTGRTNDNARNTRTIEELKEKLAGIDQTGKAQVARDLGDLHALVLDVSRGKTLWDTPRGKVLRVEAGQSQVVIDLGSVHGVKPGLTFNVFGASRDGRAEKQMKGTVEIVKVNELVSTARVTSLYDRDGQEIPLADPSSVKAQREADNALQTGDLLFNLTWGTHVILAGVMDVDDQKPVGPAAEMVELDRLRKVLERQGVIVDGFVDLRDGTIKGGLTPQTAYVIRGASIYGEGKVEEGAPDRAKAVNEAINALKKEAADRGIFVISPRNFAAVVGYRSPRSALDRAVSTFRPGLPWAGTGLERAPEKDAGKPPANPDPVDPPVKVPKVEPMDPPPPPKDDKKPGKVAVPPGLVGTWLGQNELRLDLMADGTGQYSGFFAEKGDPKLGVFERAKVDLFDIAGRPAIRVQEVNWTLAVSNDGQTLSLSTQGKDAIPTTVKLKRK